jgi:hypothetical protein
MGRVSIYITTRPTSRELNMSEIRTARQSIIDFLEKNKAVMGSIEVVTTVDGRTINLSDMTDEEAVEVADMLMGVGTPTRLGALAKIK